MSSKRRKRKPENEEFLKSILAVDTSEREIRSNEPVLFKCHYCDKTGYKKYSEAKRSMKKNGFAFQCPDCLKLKMKNRSEKWLSKIRAAAQSEEHKNRARENGRKRIKYSPNEIQKVLSKSGVHRFEGDLSTPSNTIKIFWPDGASRSVLIRRFMKEGCIDRPKTGNLNPNKIRHLKSLEENGLTVEVIGEKNARITYKGYTWEQYWVNAIDRKCSLMMSKIDKGNRIKELMALGKSLNAACIEVGVSPVTYYRRFAEGETCPVNIAVSINNIENLLQLDGAIYNRKVFDGFDVRPDIYLKDSNLVIEIDGLKWHTEEKKGKKYHKERFDFYQSQGLDLLVFSEKEVKESRVIVESMIAHKRGLTDKSIGARSCKLRFLTPSQANDFFKENHLKGAGSGAAIGLFHNGDIVCALRFIEQSDHINISRFACKNGWSVQGGYSKLMDKMPIGKDVVNFVDHRHGSGKHLLNHGFTKVSEHTGFEWTDGYNAFNRRSFSGNSGKDRGLSKYWDYGQSKYVKLNKFNP